jgi:hypothetical protein
MHTVSAKLSAGDRATVSVPCDTPVGYVTKATAAAVAEFEKEVAATKRRESRLKKIRKRAEKVALKEQCPRIKCELRPRQYFEFDSTVVPIFLA